MNTIYAENTICITTALTFTHLPDICYGLIAAKLKMD